MNATIQQVEEIVSVLTAEQQQLLKDTIRYAHEQKKPGHSFAVEYKEKRKIYKRTAGLPLSYNYYHRQQYQANAFGKVAIVAYVEPAAVDECCQCKGC